MTVDAFVLHPSVTATWLLPEGHDEASRRVYARLRASTVDAHAPEHWLWECGDLIANGVRRSRIAAADAMLVWSVLDAIRTRVELVPLQPAQLRACLALGIDDGLSASEAAYLWLSMSLRRPLLARDDRLAAAAARHRVTMLAPEDVA